MILLQLYYHFKCKKTLSNENQKHEYMKIAENSQGEKHLDDYLSIHKKMLNHHIKACTIEKKNQLYKDTS